MKVYVLYIPHIMELQVFSDKQKAVEYLRNIVDDKEATIRQLLEATDGVLEECEVQE